MLASFLVFVAGCAAPSTLDSLDTAEIAVGDQTLAVLIADTSSERRQGLRHVEELPAGLDGMLFVFADPRTASFVMEDTLMPLDIWWFGADGRLLGSAEMEPCPSEPCTSYGSPGEIGWALETPAGELELVPGDVLTVDAGP